MLETISGEKNDNPILRDSLKNQMVLQSFKMILTEALCVFLHLRKKPIRRQFWNSLQVDTDDDISVDISFWAKPRQTPQHMPLI